MTNLSATILGVILTASVVPLQAADYVTKPRTGHTPVTVATATVSRDAGRFASLAPTSPGTILPTSMKKHTRAVKAPYRSGAAPVNLRGAVIYPSSSTGMYSVPYETGGSFELLAAGVDANGGGVEIDGTYYAAYKKLVWGIYASYYIQAYDSDTWELKGSARSVTAGMMATDVALDPVTGKVYGCYYNDNGTGPVFGTADYESGVRTIIKPLDVEWNACAFDAEGNLYAIDINGVLNSVDKTTGAITRIGSTGLKPHYVSSGTIDTRSGRFFYSCKPDLENSAIYEVDVTDGSVTHLYTCPEGEEIAGMYVSAPLADDKAPAAITSLIADFPAGTLDGTISFSVPAKTFDGETASGDLTYIIEANGVTVASGSTSFGADENIAVTVKEAGNYEFAVAVANETGSSPRVRVSAFVGNDTPEPVSDVTLTRADGRFHLSWHPVTTTVNGGYIDVDAVTYIVTRYPDNIIVNDAVTGTSLIDEVPDPDGIVNYHYTVVAVAAGIKSGETQSNTITIGAITPPYREDFEDGDVLKSFTVIDANNDGWRWMWDYGSAWLAASFYDASDDWLITPPLRLEAGKMYRVSLEAFGANTVERLEIKWGAEATAAGMTETLLPPAVTEGNSMNPLRVNEFIRPDADGIYYIGIHGISDADSYGLYIDNLEISEPIAQQAPAAVTGFTADPEAPCSLRAVISFTAPLLALDGTQLESLSSIEVLRDGVLVETVTDPVPGKSYSVYDTVEASGYYDYSVVAINDAGTGKESTSRVFLGINIPAPVTALKVVENGIDGNVTISWSAPEVDVDGKAIDPSVVTYRIIELTENGTVNVADNLTDTSYSYQTTLSSGSQELKQWAVYAVTRSGASIATESTLVAVGHPYVSPYTESFANANTSSIFGVSVDHGDGYWGIYPDSAFDDVSSQDRDNGVAAMTGYRYLDEATLFTGKIKLGSVSPGLSFYLFKIADDDNNTLALHIDAGNGLEPLRELEISQLPAVGWNLISVPLDKYAGQNVQIHFTGTILSYEYIIIDNITVGSLLNRNLCVSDVVVPKYAVPGTPLSISVEVSNIGLEVADGYEVVLYRDSEAVATDKGGRLDPGQVSSTTFTDVVSPLAGDVVAYHAEIIWSDDEDTADNNSELFSVSVKHPSHPVVTGLAGEITPEGVMLSWSAPEIEVTEGGTVTESFEDYDAFTTMPGDWTLIDMDKEPIGNVGAIGGGAVEIPGIASGSSQSWWVWDLDELPLSRFDGPFAAHSGSKFLTQLFNDSGVANDDWAISPQLTGEAQTISLYACSMQRGLTESFEILCSSTTPDVESFTLVRKVAAVPVDWTRYTFDLPEGTMYFAIRCVSKDRFMLHIDDVTFARAASASSLELIGYNLYRDGVKITPEPVSATSAIDTEVGEGTHTYHVTAVYDRGESRGSNPVTLSMSGIDTNVANDIDIQVSRNEIVITGATGTAVIVSNPAGVVIHSSAGAPEIRIPVTPGLYIVKAADHVKKLIVK